VNTVRFLIARRRSRILLAAGLALGLTAGARPARAALPPAGSVILELQPAVIFGGTKDMEDLYGQGLIWPASGGWVGAFDLGLGYAFSERFQLSVMYGGRSKLWSVTDEYGVTEDWDLGVTSVELRGRYMIPTAGSVCWGLGGGLGSGSLHGTYRASVTGGELGQLDLTGSNTSGWVEFGPEWRWTRFALGLTGGYRFLTIEPVGAKGRIMGLSYSTRRLPTITGRKAHFDYSGFTLGLACRWYLGGRVHSTPAAVESTGASESHPLIEPIR
jgi:hypothetical protein